MEGEYGEGGMVEAYEYRRRVHAAAVDVYEFSSVVVFIHFVRSFHTPAPPLTPSSIRRRHRPRPGSTTRAGQRRKSHKCRNDNDNDSDDGSVYDLRGRCGRFIVDGKTTCVPFIFFTDESPGGQQLIV